jgi:hypothetical protein
MRTYAGAALRDQAQPVPHVMQLRMLTYADVCGRMRTYAGAALRDQAQPVPHVMQLRMLTYADVC